MHGITRRCAGAYLAAMWVAGVSCGERPAPPAEPQPTDQPRTTARVLQVGDPAPDFSLPGSDGKIYSLASYKGRQAVVLAWFAKAFTGG